MPPVTPSRICLLASEVMDMEKPQLKESRTVFNLSLNGRNWPLTAPAPQGLTKGG